MSNSFFYNYTSDEKDDLKYIKISDIPNKISLIDTSGSTSGSILRCEKDLVRIISHSGSNQTPFVSWNSKATYFDSIQSLRGLRSSGNTLPSNLFVNDNTDVCNAIAKSNAIVFTTDGQVSPEEIERFSRYANKFSHASILILVLFYNSNNLQQLPISVFAPLLTHPNSILLHARIHNINNQYPTASYNVLYCNQNLQKQLTQDNNIEINPIDFKQENNNNNNNDNTILSSKLSDINIKQFLECKIQDCSSRKPLEQGYQLVSSGLAINLDKLLSKTQDILLSNEWKIVDDNFPDLVFRAKNEGKIQILRQWIQSQQSILYNLIRVLMDECRNNNTLWKESQSEIESIMKILSPSQQEMQNDASAIAIDQYRKGLRNAYHSQKKANQEIESQLFSNQQYQLYCQYKSNIQSWLQQTTNVEKSSYNIYETSINLGNRAKRATRVENVLSSSNDDNIFSKLDFNGSPLIECSICMDQKTGCFILRQCENKQDQVKTAIELNGTDYSMNFPLACGKPNLVFVSSDSCAVCIDCAKYLYHNGGKDTVRQTITGIIPIVPLDKKMNREFIYKSLAHSLGGGKSLPNLFLIFFALLDSLVRKEWIQSCQEKLVIIQYIKNQLLDNVQATSNFKEDGVTMSLRCAINTIIKDSVAIFRQPIQALFVIIRNNTTYLNFHDMHELIQYRYKRIMVENYLKFIKPNSSNLLNNEQKDQEMMYHIYNSLYECKNGVPLYNSAKLVSASMDEKYRSSVLDILMPLKLVQDIEHDWMTTSKLYSNSMSTTTSTSLPILINDVAITQIVASLIKLPYNTVEKTMQLLDQQQTKSNDYDNNRDEKTMIDQLNKNMFQSLSNNIDDSHIHVAPFATCFGPSVLVCVCGYSFLDGVSKEWCNADIIDHISNSIHKHMESVYGSCIPSNKSSHVKLHKTVSEYIKRKYPLTLLLQQKDDIQVDRQSVLDVLKLLYRQGINAKEGNIFKHNQVLNVVVALRNFISIWIKTKEIYQSDPEKYKFLVDDKHYPDLNKKIAFELLQNSLLDFDFKDSYCTSPTMTTSRIILHIESNPDVFSKYQKSMSGLMPTNQDIELSYPLTYEEMMFVLPKRSTY